MKKLVGTLVLGVLVATGCAIEGRGESPEEMETAPDATLEDLEPAGSVSAGGWTLTSHTPYRDTSGMHAKGVFTGDPGSLRPAGVCLLIRSATPHACSTVTDCAAYPSSLPAGGSRYCTAVDDYPGKWCFYRPGSRTSFCAGTPALGGALIPPGTYITPGQPMPTGTNAISYSCFNGCSNTDPSASSMTYY